MKLNWKLTFSEVPSISSHSNADPLDKIIKILNALWVMTWYVLINGVMLYSSIFSPNQSRCFVREDRITGTLLLSERKVRSTESTTE
jgi:hypothetical protein